MPISKKSKVVSLTATKKSGRAAKQELVQKIHDALKKYKNVYTLQFENMRTNLFKEIRYERQTDSRLFLGNNRVMMLALGRNEAESLQPNLYKISSFLKGSSGLLFTDLEKPVVKNLFSERYTKPDFARAGSVSLSKVTIDKGLLDAQRFPHSIFNEFTELGVPVKLEKGIIRVTEDYEVCAKGQVLTSNQCRLLKHLDNRSIMFRINLTAHWSGGVARKITP
ncbi:60S acidic ribosomal protein [Perkinsela sp. CCAP 1560/4]|nr:60S acidic ribosomal protein [Perkinsela sp. CCAP 1560/4]|eukprot:KNH04726.1 60S acidic ribosomal protein [Perkinsela sp. CCAP 1560/4]